MTVAQATRRSTYNVEAARSIVTKSDSVVDAAQKMSMLGLAHDLYVKDIEAAPLALQAVSRYKGKYDPEENYLPTAAELTSFLQVIKAEKESLEAKIIEIRQAMPKASENAKGGQQAKPYQE